MLLAELMRLMRRKEKPRLISGACLNEADLHDIQIMRQVRVPARAAGDGGPADAGRSARWLSGQSIRR